ncbi:protein-glutamate O-methyltransferase CheR [Ammoniphilus sp. 3BR4]|uniref:CheR family methyltransferase n=1 Tax=Ammoniphilus sp. 3BR4 TaxID=3158265 RepID=UPI00346710E3
MTISEQVTQINKNTRQDPYELEKIEIQLLLEGIYRFYGFDFRNYAFSFVKRRIWNRIYEERLTSISGLQEKILHDPRVMKRLFSDFSINVTEMFRDPGFFLSFRTRIVPFLKELPYIRIWHVGCSTGEEVYSMAILLYEEGLYEKTIIYGTDMNRNSLENAKKGVFPLSKMQTYTKNYLASGGTRAFSEYYTTLHDDVTFHPFLTKNVVFAQHNLATDRSFNEFHVIICRNVMIYFNKIMQDGVHNLLYESLSISGILGLGSREGIRFAHLNNYYEEVDAVEKIYRKIK